MLTTLVAEFLVFIIASVLFITIMNIFAHKDNQALWGWVLLVFSVIKVQYLITRTMRKLDVLLKDNHSFDHLLKSLGITVSIIVVSFTFDFYCLSQIFDNAFIGLDVSSSLFDQLINLLYFSVATFTNVGYGDITPAITFTKLLAIFEMISSFIIIIFMVSKYAKTSSK